MTRMKTTTLGLAALSVLMAVAAAPVRVDGLRLADQAAWAKQGADDGANHNAGDDRGRGDQGRDDGAGHR